MRLPDLETPSMLFVGVLPFFTDLIQVSTYLEDCFVLLIQVLGAPTPSARSNLTTLAEHLRNTRVNREPHSRSCWLILALLVAMLALLVAILSLLLAILSPTCPKTFQKTRSWSQHLPRQPPRCLRHLFRASQKCKKPKKTSGFSMLFTFPPIS